MSAPLNVLLSGATRIRHDSTSTDWTGSANFTFSGANILNGTAGNAAIRTGSSVLTGNFDFSCVLKSGSGAGDAFTFGFFAGSESGTFNSGSANGAMGSMTDSYYLIGQVGGTLNITKGASTLSSFTSNVNDIIIFSRSGTDIAVKQNGSTVYTFTSATSAVCMGCCGQTTGNYEINTVYWVT